MREYWRLFFLNMKQQAEVVLFAVLSRNSDNSKSHKGTTRFTKQQLQRILDGINVTWRAAFPIHCNWEEAALLVKDPALRFLLAPPEHLRHAANSGFFNTYRSRTVAFDLMLQFENENHQRFTHVLFARPDTMYDLNPNIISTIGRCPDAVFCGNDLFGAMKRNLAPWYATHVATARSWTGASQIVVNKDQTRQRIQRLLGWNFTGGGYFMPAMHLAIHGVPFAGIGLEVIANSGVVICNQSDVLSNAWIIRDLSPNVSAAVCVRQQELAGALRSFGRMGMNASLRNSLGTC